MIIVCKCTTNLKHPLPKVPPLFLWYLKSVFLSISAQILYPSLTLPYTGRGIPDITGEGGYPSHQLFTKKRFSCENRVLRFFVPLGDFSQMSFSQFSVPFYNFQYYFRSVKTRFLVPFFVCSLVPSVFAQCFPPDYFDLAATKCRQQDTHLSDKCSFLVRGVPLRPPKSRILYRAA